MKKEQIAMTSNVKKAMQAIKFLQDRPKTEMVGLGLFYGVPGVGKSRFARRFAIQNDYIYIRLESTITAKRFAVRLHEVLSERYGISEVARGSANTIFDKCIDIINDIGSDLIIFVDEVDYAFSDKKLLGSIRDIVDETLAMVILVGMQNARKELLKANAHYFDRCNSFVKFENLSKKDVHSVVNTIADIKMDKDLIDKIHARTQGTLRKVVKMIYAIENIAAHKTINQVKIDDVRGVFSA